MVSITYQFGAVSKPFCFHSPKYLTVLFACVGFPLWMIYLGKRKTSADQAEFYALAFDAATMFITKTVVGGMICTDYTDREYIVMENVDVAVGRIVAAGDEVYLSSTGFTVLAGAAAAATYSSSSSSWSGTSTATTAVAAAVAEGSGSPGWSSGSRSARAWCLAS